MKLKKRPMAAVFGSGFISWPVQFRTICPDLSRLYQTMKQWLMNDDLTDHQHTLASSLAVVLMWTVQTRRWFFFFYLWSLVPDFLFPDSRCLGLRSYTCRSDSPFLPWRFMSFCDDFIIFFVFFTIWGKKKTKIPVSCFHRNKNYTRDLIFHFPTNQRLPHSSPRLSPLCLVIQTGLVVDGKRSGCGSWKWVELRPRVCVS